MTYDSDSRKLTFLKETAHSPADDFMPVLESYTTICPLRAGIVSYESKQYKQSAFTFFSMEVCMGKGLKCMSITSTSIDNVQLEMVSQLVSLDRAHQKLSSEV